MPLFKTNNIKISGLAAAVPKTIYSNKDYDWVPENERDLLIKTIGVQERRIAAKGTATSDLCFEAAEKLIAALNWEKESIQLLIFVSQTFDYQIPSTAIILQDRLKLPKSTIAFDINLGCSGYVYGLSVVSSLMNTTGIKKALFLAGDVSTLNASYKDKSAFPLFGDAGTATALELDDNAQPMFFNLNSDGSGFDAIYVKDGGMRNFICDKSFEVKKYGEGIYRNDIQIALNGIEVFNFGLKEVKPNVIDLLNYAGKTIDDIDYFVFHQANKLMNETIRKKIKIPPEKFPYSIEKYGNTSSASIPLTMLYKIKNELEENELDLVLSGFGVGLSWGTVFLKTNKVKCLPIIEYDDC
ncbi:MAG: ketoacyl-ACP synthase III [Vicingaceae bacterium]